MKTGNIISISLILFLFGGVLFCDFVLASAYKKINLDDPFKNFSSVPLRPFKTLSILGGNGYAIELRQAEKPAIKLLNSRKSFFNIYYSGDTAHISFKVANQTYQSPEDCIKGLIISAPALPDCVLNGVNTTLNGFHTDSILLRSGLKAQVRLNDIHTKKLQIFADSESTVDLQKNNQTDLLVLNMKQRASVTLNDIQFQKFDKLLDDSATLRLFEPGFKAVWKTLVSPVEAGEK